MRMIVKRSKPLDVQEMVAGFFKDSESDRAVVEIKEDHLTRSQKQNRLYFAWVMIFCEHTGYTKDECHLLLADKFLGRFEFTSKTGKEISQIRSTSDLGVKEFTDYLEQIDQLGSEYSLTLPRPADLYYAAMGIGV